MCIHCKRGNVSKKNAISELFTFRMRRCKGKKINLNTISCQTANGNIQIIFEWCINVWWMLISRNKIKYITDPIQVILYSQKRTFRSWELTLASHNKKTSRQQFCICYKTAFLCQIIAFWSLFFTCASFPKKNNIYDAQRRQQKVKIATAAAAYVLFVSVRSI